MEYKELAEGVGIPVLGQGTGGFGAWITERSRDGDEVSALRSAIDLGITHIDTAESYRAGHAEELVGEAIKPYDRSNLFITTKVSRDHLRYNDLIKSMKSSLRRLGTDYVDLYLIHHPNPIIPLEETMRALEHCAKKGYTRFLGVSNFSASLLDEAQSHLREHRLVANQVHYSLLMQDPKEMLLPYCQENDVMLISYRPLERGRLVKPGFRELDRIAKKYSKTRAQISLNWLISQEKVIAIPRSTKVEHLKDNLKAIGWRISDNEYGQLEESFQ